MYCSHFVNPQSFSMFQKEKNSQENKKKCVLYIVCPALRQFVVKREKTHHHQKRKTHSSSLGNLFPTNQQLKSSKNPSIFELRSHFLYTSQPAPCGLPYWHYSALLYSTCWAKTFSRRQSDNKQKTMKQMTWTQVWMFLLLGFFFGFDNGRFSRFNYTYLRTYNTERRDIIAH